MKYEVKAKFTFSGIFTVEADSPAHAKEIIKTGCKPLECIVSASDSIAYALGDTAEMTLGKVKAFDKKAVETAAEAEAEAVEPDPVVEV